MQLSKIIKRVRQQPVFSDRRGDTIIEVLIAIGIVSLVLTSAYALTNRNAQSAQKTQEQGQAQKLIESQIELMRGYDSVINDDDCLSGDPTLHTLSGDACKNIFAASSGAAYTLRITRPDSIHEPTLYKIKATWDALGGQTGNVTMYYRR